MRKTQTVATVIAALQLMPQELPVLVGTNYDNDTYLTELFEVRTIDASHMEDEFWMENDLPATKAVAIY